MISYPHIFLEGPQAMIVSSALDPDNLLVELSRRGFRPELWTAKLTGTDTGGVQEIEHGLIRARAHGMKVGGWIQCGPDPRADVASVAPWVDGLDYMQWCCEIEYKGNPPYQANAKRADELVAEVRGSALQHLPHAVVSYGRRDLYMRMQVFRDAGWAVIPECYEHFSLDQADTYVPVWPGRAVHPMTRTLPPPKYRGNRTGIYRPEGLL